MADVVDLASSLAAALAHEVIGRSSEGRPIAAWRLGPPGTAELVVVAGVHGDEPASVEAAVDLAGRVTAGEVAAAPFWLVAALNPDGLVRGQKNSAHDVDLNRNFPAANFSVAHASGYAPGDAPLSEPETRALVTLLDRAQIQRLVAVHAPFACVNYDGPAEDWARDVSRACGWPVQADIGYPTPGSLGSWWGRDRQLPILTLELPPGAFAGFREPCRAALAASVVPPGSAMNPSRMR